MAIISVTETTDGEGATFSRDTTRLYTRTFRVITDSVNHRPDEIALAPGLPRGWDRHPSDITCFVEKVTPKRVKGTREVWDVTASYTNKLDEDDEPDENPLRRPWKLSWTSQTYSHAALVGVKRETFTAGGSTIAPAPGAALSGPVLNSAGDKFDPPIEIEASNWQLTAKKNIATVPSWLMDYRDSLNHASITIAGINFQARELRLNSMTIGEWTYENDIGFYPFEIQIAQKQETWIHDLLDQGTHEIKTINVGGVSTEERLRIVDGRGQHITDPVRLNGSGGKLSPADAPIEDSVFIRYQLYLKERNYTALGLPIT